MKKNVVIILAGGTGSRFGLDIPKQFAKLAGKTILEHTVNVFQKYSSINEIAIVSHPDWIWKIEEIVEQNSFTKVKKVLIGGDERKDSSLSAIKAYESERENVNFIFHDAVRPFVTNKIIDQCIEALNQYNAIDVAIPAVDTIINVNNAKIIENIPERASMMQGQTPQCFRYETIYKAYENALSDPDFKATDDCGIVKRYLPEEDIYVVQGSNQNIKITHPQDIFLADKLIQLRTMQIQERYSNRFYHEKIDGKVVVIFGGSYGIGKEVGDLLKGFGAKVYSFSRSSTNTDVSSLSDIREAFSFVYNKENRIDYVVNTASILVKESLKHTDYSKILDIININYLGAINIAKEAMKYLEESQGGILNFTSSSYTRGRANYSLYSSTKAAIVNLTQALGEELIQKRIRVNCINPERTSTPMRSSNFGYEDPATLLTAEEVAYTSINTLLSDFTGQIVDVKIQKVQM